MLQRLRDALGRGRSDRHPSRQYRPNELRLDTVRADRLRREAQRGASPANLPGRSLEEQHVRREPAIAAPSASTRAEPWQVTALKTRSGLRQAWLLKEILAPPIALRDPRDVGSGL